MTESHSEACNYFHRFPFPEGNTSAFKATVTLRGTEKKWIATTDKRTLRLVLACLATNDNYSFVSS